MNRVTYPVPNAGVPSTTPLPSTSLEDEDPADASGAGEMLAPAHRISEERVEADEKVLHKMVEPLGMGMPGEDWFKLAIDPFHDTRLPKAGWPVLDGYVSNVATVKKTMTLTAPLDAKGDPVPSWDCHVVILPLLQTAAAYAANITMFSGLRATVYGPPPGAGPGRLGLVTAVCVATGQPTFPSTDHPINPHQAGMTVRALGIINIDPVTGLPDGDIMDGRTRLVSCGVECALTGPNVAGAGTCVTYSMNGAAQQMAIANPDGSRWRQTTVVRGPPSTIDQALNQPDSDQWPAREGAYLRGMFTTMVNPATQPTVDGFMMFGDDITPRGYTGTTAPVITNAWSVGPTNSTPWGLTTTVAPLNVSGAYFQGLSGGVFATSSGAVTGGDQVTVTLRAYPELFPTVSEITSLLLSRPAPAFDPVAQEMYTRTTRVLPPAVRLAENPLGEFFHKAVSAAAASMPIAEKALAALPHPKARAASAAIGKLSKLTKTARAEEKAVEGLLALRKGRRAKGKGPAPSRRRD